MEHRNQLADLVGRVRAFITAREHSPALFGELALAIFRFQFNHNPAYARYCRAIGIDPARVRRWEEIPSVITSAFKEQDWTVLPAEDRSATFLSSGTTATEKRSRHFHCAETLGLYEASLVEWFRPFLLPDSTKLRFVMLTPTPSQVPNSSLVHMFETVSAKFGSAASYHATVQPDGAWELDHASLLPVLSSEPVVLCGTAFSFVHLCDALAANPQPRQLPPGSRVFETGGYKGRSRSVAKEELHGMIAQSLGVPQTHIITEYGMSELSSQAYDRVCGSGAPRSLRFPPWSRVRLISPETGQDAKPGEPGLIRISDLANVGSVMAIQTEDLGIATADGFHLIGRAQQSEARGCSLMPAG